MVVLLLLLIGFAAGAAYAYHRWRALGVVLFSLLLIGVELARGTIVWMQPHRDGAPRPWDWPCHATGAIVPVLMLGTGVLLVLHLLRNQATSLFERMLIALITCIALTYPVMLGAIWWAVMFLKCDSL